MATNLTHEIELYPFESFKILLEHEVVRARRYRAPLTLIHLVVASEPSTPETQHNAEVFAINVLNLHLRETDVPCREGNEFLVLMPVTNEQGARTACERLEKLFKVEPQSLDRISFKLSAFIGVATLSVEDTITSKKLLDQAQQALEHARANHLTNPVVFSDLKA